jgi:hypothetical protein
MSPLVIFHRPLGPSRVRCRGEPGVKVKKSDGYYYITADDWDEAPFFLLLYMLHSQTGVPPQSVSLEMMAKITVIVDYYDCGGAIKIFTNPWLQLLEDTEERIRTLDLPIPLAVPGKHVLSNTRDSSCLANLT